MEHELDVRGARCPVPYVRAKGRVGALAPGDTLVVLTTDPEARIDLAALAADEGLTFDAGDGTQIALTRSQA
jgi:tRNA 2-thiouridine synthesizing protein A